VLFPIKDETGSLVAVSGRYVDGRNSTKTKAGGRKSIGVFSTPGALKAGAVAIVEGPIDALSLALCGLPAVAMIGTSWAEWLPRSLSPKPILIATDADEAGDEAAQRLREVFTGSGCQALRLRPSCGKDWNDVLVRMGGPSLRDALKGFAPETSDAIRFGFARRLRMSGRRVYSFSPLKCRWQ
jgi:DNA primase